MLSHVKSGAIYHNYSISPNISSSFFDFSSLFLSFRRFMPQFCCIALWVTASLPQLCRPARARLLTIFPLFSRAFAPLPTAFADSYRKARACVSYDTSLRFLCYEASCLTIRAADSHLQSCRRAWRAERRRMAEWAGGGLVQPRRQTAVCHGYWRVGIKAPLPRIGPLGTPIYSLWSNRDNLGRVDIYQKCNHFVNFFRSFAF